MRPTDTELDDVLRELTGAGMYRNNVFRMTGLPTSASPQQIRRRREEAALAAQLGMPPAAASGELPLAPAPDRDAVNAAFESLRNPVLRLVHELLWLRGTEDDHDYAVRRHCGVLEGPSFSAPGRPEVDEDPLGYEWLVALQAWADVLSSEETWDWARRRVKEIGDPRLTTGTVRRLRDRLPAHIAGVSIALAVKAAEEIGVEAADRHLWLLDESPFDEDMVDLVLRDAVRPAEARVHTACETADRVSLTSPQDAITAGHALLTQVRSPLRVIAGLLGADDPVTAAAHDLSARSLNLCAVSHDNLTSAGGPALTLLPKARSMARERTTIELIDKNLAVINDQLVTGKVEDLRVKSRVDKAADRLRALRRHTTDERLRDGIDKVLADPMALRAPLTGSLPFRGSWFGWGMYLMGKRWTGDGGKFVTTHFITVFFVPVIPVAAHLRDDLYFYGKVPMSRLTRWWRLVALLLLAFFVIGPFGDPARLLTFLAMILATAGVLAWRRQRLDKWAAAVAGG
ncbi:hypothetical protein [Amycolatopsis nigrescens]|uniref:hypothetical protein n=1 Tax=Amycolatopsis nigrescens TaxID=381445 RepID=UPI0003602147|nr:hypothetical protein [Amycolatopsis nigrescens]